jgi:DNA-binding IclR family transcriptional regulator
MLQTVDRALRLLLLFEEVDQEYRVGEIAAMLGVEKSGASRLAATLANRGFLERVPGSEAFRIGPELGRLGMLNVSSSHNLIELARRPMENLATETAETVNLARLEDRKVVNIAQVDGAHLVGVGDWVGWKTEPHATANGKVLLAFTENLSEHGSSRALWRCSPGRRSRTSRISAPSSIASDRRVGRRLSASLRRGSTVSLSLSPTRSGAAGPR